MLLRAPDIHSAPPFSGESTCDHVASVSCDCKLRSLFRYWGTFPACACSRGIARALNELHVLFTADQLSLTRGCHVPSKRAIWVFVSCSDHAILAERGHELQGLGRYNRNTRTEVDLHLRPSPVCLTGHRFASQQAYRHTLRFDAILRQHPKAWGVHALSEPENALSQMSLIHAQNYLG